MSARSVRRWLTLSPRFRLVRRLGAGAFGTVYEVHDRTLGRKVALKTLEGVDGDRFLADLPSLAAIVHPNLCRILDGGKEGAVAWYTMERVDGVELLRYLRPPHHGDETPKPSLVYAFGSLVQPLGVSAFRGLDAEGLARLRHVMVQVVDGLGALHDAGKVHRDLESSNVMVDASGRAVVLDLGMAADAGRPPDDALAGAPEYVAPELGQGAPVGFASDWYSLGVALFAALTGELPFTGTGHEIFVRKATVSAPRASLLVADTPADLDDLCARLLERRPEARLCDPGEIRAMLRGRSTSPNVPDALSR